MDSSSVSGFIPTIAIALMLSKGSYSRIQESEFRSQNSGVKQAALPGLETNRCVLH
ncbi:hypothetical protein [Nostoc sp. NMS9]|uniref:hypothetical protein n=1 Tax=Nostoc sp. NMS9 TaxID=2815393 RepID=UPI0025EDC6EC|nr:hypothetical protein [Nostoc sp. NMS9]